MRNRTKNVRKNITRLSWKCPFWPDAGAGHHHVGFCSFKYVVDRPCGENLSHGFIDHFLCVTRSNSHWTQEPYGKHLLQERIWGAETRDSPLHGALMVSRYYNACVKTSKFEIKKCIIKCWPCASSDPLSSFSVSPNGLVRLSYFHKKANTNTELHQHNWTKLCKLSKVTLDKVKCKLWMQLHRQNSHKPIIKFKTRP